MSLAAVFRVLVHKDGLSGVQTYHLGPLVFQLINTYLAFQSVLTSSIPDESYSHFYASKNFDRNYVPLYVSETFFLFTPLKLLSSFHTTMWISHYKWFSIYILLLSVSVLEQCKRKGSPFQFKWTYTRRPSLQFFSIILRQIDKNT